jgi:hypothetical protein
MGLLDKLFGRKRTSDEVNGAKLYEELYAGRPRASVDELVERARSLPRQQSAVVKQSAAIESLRRGDVAKAKELIIEALREAGISLPSRSELEAESHKESLSATQRRAITFAILSRLVLDGEIEDAKALLNRAGL